jgi:4-amino-4-deoxy-L-arabinose transferase-like glycosyltransferase
VGALIRGGLLAWIGGLQPTIVDEQHYLELANSLLDGRGYAWSDGQPTSIRPPLYPAFVAGVWTVTGTRSLLAVRLVQAMLALVCIWFVFRLASDLFDEKTGGIAALGFSLYPSWLYANTTLLTETLFTLLLLLAVWFVHRAVIEKAPLKMAFAGGCCGLASLTRSVLWPFPVLAVPVLWVSTHGSWKRKIVAVLMFTVAHVLVLAPWSLRNTRVQGVFTVVDTMSGFNLWMANSDATPDDRIWAAVSQGGQEAFSRGIRREFPRGTLTEGQKDKWGRAAAFKYMLEHPMTTLRRSVRKFADFWGLERELVATVAQGGGPPLAAALAAGLTLAAYPLVMMLAVVGAWSTEKRAWPTHAFILALVVLITGVHTIVFGHSRYRLPLMAFGSIYAAAAIEQRSWRRILHNRAMLIGAGLSIALLLVIWAEELLVRDFDRVRGFVARLMS